MLAEPSHRAGKKTHSSIYLRHDMFFVSSFSHLEKFSSRIPELYAVLVEVKKIADGEFQPGARYICDGKIKVNSEEVMLTEVGYKQLEWHREFIDIHVPLTKEEIIGWKQTSDIRSITKDYNPENDIAFSDDPSEEYIRLKPGEFVILNPEDAHAPCQGSGVLRKLCVKIPVRMFG